MSFNNAPLIKALDRETTPPQQDLLPVPPLRRRVVSEPCLPERLPNTSFLHREAEGLAPIALRKELGRNDPGPKDPEPETDEILALPGEGQNTNAQLEEDPPQSPTESQHKPSFFKSIAKSLSGFNAGASTRKRPQPTSWANVQPFEVMRAVEESDIVFLMEVRDKAFPLLLRTSGGQTPLVHAIRIGKRDVAIVLLGAFSRYINHLEDSDIRKAETQSQLKVLRTGLKLAINQGLANSQPDLIASFMQTLIMSEGDQWIWAQVSMVSRELNAGAEGRPVESAGTVVRKFTTRELGKAGLIASLEDYIANATADLLMMGAWSIVLQSISADNLPTYFFARDDRVYKAFAAMLETNKADIDRKCPRQLRLQLKILQEGLEGRQLTFRRKVELLSEKLDSGQSL